MLVLGRYRDQKIIIGDGVNCPKIEIVVIDIRGDKVRLGVEADPDIPVHRQEVYDAIHRAKEKLA